MVIDLFNNPVGCLTSHAISRLTAAKLQFLAEVVRKLKFPNNFNEGETIFLSGLGQYIEIDNMSDYWYRIKMGNRNVWIFGSFVDFQKEIEF
jgi:hypothetical protein